MPVGKKPPKTNPLDEEIAKIGIALDLNVKTLDQDWINQPKMRFYWGCKLADAKMELDEARRAEKLRFAEIKRDMRSDPAEYGIEKVTDKAIEEAAEEHDEYQAMGKAVLTAKHRVDILEAAIESLNHRKKGLEDLVRLFLADYFADPKADAETHRAVDEMGKKRMHGVKTQPGKEAARKALYEEAEDD